MKARATEDPRAVAIAQLEQFGLSSYAAQTFVGLASLGTGTARDVSQVTDVPRTRVYDAIDELRQRNLVDVQQSSPREFWAISAETASRTLERDLQRRTAALRTALGELEPAERQSEQRGVWTVDGRTAITDRLLAFFDTAEEEIVYMTVEDLLTDELLAGLRGAADRGVAIKLAGLSPATQAEIREEIPDAETFESLWVWSDTAAGRLMMVDGRKTLVSVRVNGRDEAPSVPREETAIWGEGDANSLVVILRAIFTHRLQDGDT